MSLEQWAVPQLMKLLPLDEDSLKQIISYADTLPREAAASHFKDLLGESPQSIEFITSFNQRRPPPPGETIASSNVGRSNGISGVPKPHRKVQPKKKNFNQLPPPRKVEDFGSMEGAYQKKDVDDYMSGPSRRRPAEALSEALALDAKPEAKQLPTPDQGLHSKTQKLPPSAAGVLISEEKRSRSSSPAAKAKAKVNVTGGTSMRGASTTLNDLDSAIRALEMQTNPTLAANADVSKRKCGCMATKHDLLAAAPNCMNCGKIICAKEGIGPCTFCGTPLLSSSEIQEMVHALKEERGREKQEANNAAHKRAEVSKAPRPFGSNLSTPAAGSSAASSDSESEMLVRAKQHRDRLLKFQAENARRTHIHDEAADFETPDAGTSMWATPQERALQLKKQQKVLREQEWNARPDYEKRQMVVSIDVKTGKAVRKFADVERRPSISDSDQDADSTQVHSSQAPSTSLSSRGAFSKNPLLGSLIRPVYNIESKGKGVEAPKKSRWRRVQDDNDDNEQWILDGGAYGDRADGRVLTAEEHACG